VSLCTAAPLRGCLSSPANMLQADTVHSPSSLPNGPKVSRAHWEGYLAWWCTPVVPALERLRQDDFNLQDSPGDTSKTLFTKAIIIFWITWV
jgi:hypothetical protein